MAETDSGITQFLKLKRFFESAFYLCSIVIALDLIYFLSFILYHQSDTSPEQFAKLLPGTIQPVAIISLFLLPPTAVALLLWFYAWRRLRGFDKQQYFLTEIPPQQQLRRTLIGVGGLNIILFFALLFGGKVS